MFQFPGFPATALCVQTALTGHDPGRVPPFGHPWIDGWLAPPQGLSQLPTSFIGSRCQGIHRVLFPTCRRDARARYEVLKDPPHPTRGAARRTPSFPESCTGCQHAPTGPPSPSHPPPLRRESRQVPGSRASKIRHATSQRSTEKTPTRTHERGTRRGLLQKGGDPAAPSGTATLLRLRPNRRSHLRRLPPLRVRPPASGVTDFHDVTGGVYKARERIHRGVADPRLLATPTSRSRVADSDPN
jgi:hypothetical protein